MRERREIILKQIDHERERQIVKWGIQDIPVVDRVLMNRPGGCTGPRMCQEYEIPSEVRAKYACNTAMHNKSLTFAHAIVEELSESISAAAESGELSAAVENEFIQLAALVVQTLEVISLRRAEAPGGK